MWLHQTTRAFVDNSIINASYLSLHGNWVWTLPLNSTLASKAHILAMKGTLCPHLGIVNIANISECQKLFPNAYYYDVEALQCAQETIGDRRVTCANGGYNATSPQRDRTQEDAALHIGRPTLPKIDSRLRYTCVKEGNYCFNLEVWGKYR